MHPFWRTNTGKLIIGGCGTQVGMLVALVSLVVVVVFCAVCVLANAFGMSLTQQVAEPSTVVTVEVAASSSETLELVQARVNLLADKVNSIEPQALILPSPTPIPPKPLATAQESGVNLRSGPSKLYHRIGRLPKGESLEVVGRNADSTWWLVTTPSGALAWLSDMVVVTSNIDDSIPVVTIPALLVQPAANSPVGVTDSSSVVPTVAAATTGPVLPQPAGTPTPAAATSRRFVQDTLGYKQLIRRLLLPTVSESFSPDGQQIAISEKIKLYTITTDGANSRTLLDDDDLTLVGGAVWSPDGRHLAFVAERLQDCEPCRTVGLVRIGDGEVILLEPPPDSGLDRPRWTQDGRLLVTAFLKEPAGGATFIYDTSGQGQPVSGSYLLSSSHDGQKWFPWQPGRVWSAGNAERPDSYYGG